MSGQKPRTQAITIQDRANTLAAGIAERKSSFASVAGKHFNVDRMIKLAQASLSRTPKLAECTKSSVLTVLMRCAELGLEPNSPLGGMHLVPFENRRNGTVECQGIIDYRGLVSLARRSGELRTIFAEPRYEKDKWKRVLGTAPSIVHEPADDEDRGKILGFYAVAQLASGETQFAYMTKAEVDAIKARAKGGDNPKAPWNTDYTEMGKKTVLRRVCKLLPMTSEIADQLAREDAIDKGEPIPVEIDVTLGGDDGGDGGGQGEGAGASGGTAGEVERALAGAGAGQGEEKKQGGKDEPGSDG